MFHIFQVILKIIERWKGLKWYFEADAAGVMFVLLLHVSWGALIGKEIDEKRHNSHNFFFSP